MLSRAQSPAVVISMRPRYSQPGFKKRSALTRLLQVGDGGEQACAPHKFKRL